MKHQDRGHITLPVNYLVHWHFVAGSSVTAHLPSISNLEVI